MISDRLYKYGINKAIGLQAGFSQTFFYNYNFKTLFGLAEYMSGQTEVNLGKSKSLKETKPVLKILKILGTAHGEDVLLMFHSIFRDDVPLSEDEVRMRISLIDMLLGFSFQDKIFFGEIEMEPISKDDIEYLNIKSLEDYEIKKFGDYGNASFWDEILHYANEN